MGNRIISEFNTFFWTLQALPWSILPNAKVTGVVARTTRRKEELYQELVVDSLTRIEAAIASVSQVISS